MKTNAKDYDLGLRHKPGIHCHEFVERYTEVLNEFAYATNDGTWGQLEKQIAHVLNMSHHYKQALARRGFTGDPRKDPLGGV